MEKLGISDVDPGVRIVVAMSGGVDSSVTAALLVEQGFDVVGVTLQLYDHGKATGRKGACCAGQDIRDARRVADDLGIPHYVLDYENRFRTGVMDYFADSYLRGETPIPCVRCNQTVKFRDLLETARDLGARALVTGHYVRRIAGPGGPELHRARDHAKDQSYFLFATTREQLEFLRFPLGEVDKSETRAHAARFDLPVAEKAESQDICFVPDGSYAGVLAKLRPGAWEPGDIVDLDGNVLGRHEGVIHFTVGQRRGLGVAAAEPLYVVRLEPSSREVVVGPKTALATPTLRLTDVNWLEDGEPPVNRKVSVKIRSTTVPVPATVSREETDSQMVVTFDTPELGVAPGQACVIYDGDRVLGGGWIARSGAD